MIETKLLSLFQTHQPNDEKMNPIDLLRSEVKSQGDE